GLEAAAAAGIVAGRPELDLEVLSQVTDEEIQKMGQFLGTCPIQVVPAAGDRVFYIRIIVEADGHNASCEIVDAHTNVTEIRRDDQVLFQAESRGTGREETDRSVLTVEEIVRFADCLDPRDVAPMLRRQIAY